MKIVAFGHRMGVGKDTAAKFLSTILKTSKSGIVVKKYGFADKVKAVSFDLFEWAGLKPGPYYDTPETYKLKDTPLEKIDKTPRQIWIGVGNGIRNTTGYDHVWADYLFNTVEADVLIISDLRFPGEANRILEYDGLLVKIECPWTPVVTDGADDKLEGYDGWNVVVHNDQKGNLGRLHLQIAQIAKDYLL